MYLCALFMAQDNQDQMSFLQHLEQLRWHLVRSVIAIIVLAIVAFVNKSFLFDDIIFAPKQGDFWTFRQLCALSSFLHDLMPGFVTDPKVLCIGQNLPDLQNINMAGQFTTHILASLIAGLVLGFPYLVWELWRFIKPGLSSKEIKNTRGLVFFVSILFAIGITFGYYIISPLSVNFFLTYQISDSVTSIPTLSTYISTVITVVLASGFIFELPVAVYFLTKAGIVSPELLKKYRRHFFVAALILAAIITPPDVFSQLLVCLPLVILYEISIFLSGRILKAES